MSLRIWKLVSVSLLLAGAFGYERSAVRPVEGRLELVVRPETAAASSRPVHGTFAVRSLDSAGKARATVSVGAAYETLSTVLPAGLYAIEWQPETSFEDPATAVSAVSPQTLVIAAGRVTTLNVRVSSTTSPDARLAALDLAPSANLPLVSR